MKAFIAVVLFAIIGATSSSNPLECGACKLAVNGLKDLLDKKDITGDVVNFMEKSVCHILPSADQPLCDAVMESGIPKVVELAEEKFLNNDALCDDIHACTDKKMLGGNSIECTLCEAAISWVEKEAQDPSVQQFVEKELDKVCGLLPQQYQDTCTGVVAGFGPTLISWIAGKLDAVCDVFHCNSAAIQQAEDGLLCDLCEKAVGGITDLLNNYNVSGYVEDFLDANLCTKLGSYEALCEAAVDTEAPQIVAAIEAKILNPQTLCTDVKLCSSNAFLSSSSECAICDAAANFIGQELQNPDVQNFVDSELEKICSVMPAQYKDTCSGAIEEFGPMLLSWISGKVGVVCTDALHCSSKAVAAPNGLVCDVCEQLVGAGVKYVESLNISGFAESWMEQNLCTQLGSGEAACDAIVESSLPGIISDIESYIFNAQSLCADAGLCSTQAKNGLMCDACKTAASAIASAIDNQKVQQYIEKEVGKICPLLPQEYQSICQGVVTQFGPELAQWISSKLDGLCSYIGLC